MADDLPQSWDTMSFSALCDELNRRRATLQSTIEAMMHAVRERGVKALKEPANLERLSRCDAIAKAEINKRIARLIAAGKITDGR